MKFLPFLLVGFLMLVGLRAGAQDDFAAEKKKIAQAEKVYSDAKRSYTAKKSDPKLKKAYVKATVSLGTLVMTSVALPPKEKYPRALGLYREALKVDPNNKEAKENAKMIEDIYKSMGRPVPKTPA